MDIVISLQCDSPIYEQVYGQIAAEIMNGSLPPNSLLPSIRSIAKELCISIISVKKAWEMLESDGFIYTVVGKGSYTREHSMIKLGEKKLEIAAVRLVKDLDYYKTLGLTKEELINLIEKEF